MRNVIHIEMLFLCMVCINYVHAQDNDVDICSRIINQHFKADNGNTQILILGKQESYSLYEMLSITEIDKMNVILVLRSNSEKDGFHPLIIQEWEIDSRTKRCKLDNEITIDSVDEVPQNRGKFEYRKLGGTTYLLYHSFYDELKYGGYSRIYLISKGEIVNFVENYPFESSFDEDPATLTTDIDSINNVVKINSTYYIDDTVTTESSIYTLWKGRIVSMSDYLDNYATEILRSFYFQSGIKINDSFAIRIVRSCNEVELATNEIKKGYTECCEDDCIERIEFLRIKGDSYLKNVGIIITDNEYGFEDEHPNKNILNVQDATIYFKSNNTNVFPITPFIHGGGSFNLKVDINGKNIISLRFSTSSVECCY